MKENWINENRDAYGRIIMPERCTGVDLNDHYGTVVEGGKMSCILDAISITIRDAA